MRYLKEVRCRKGSILVFISMILACIMGITVLFAESVREKAEEGCFTAVSDLACRSLLSEYDIRLKNDYGIFAFRGDDRYAEDTVKEYIRYSADNSRGAFSYSNARIKVCLRGFEIVNTDAFEDQIVEAAKYIIEKGADVHRVCSYGSDEEEDIKDVSHEKFIKEILPSYGYGGKGIDTDLKDLKPESIRNIISKSGRTFLVNRYITSYLGRYDRNTERENAYFRNETEYVIAGMDSDEKNMEKIRSYFTVLRTPVNVAKIYKDKTRAAMALAEAQASAPPPLVPAVQLAIITEWAVEDAHEEWESLINGESIDGLSYREYLLLFLTLQDREQKLLRIMDIIQLNMREDYYDSFLLNEHYYGLSLEVVRNGKKNIYEHTY